MAISRAARSVGALGITFFGVFGIMYVHMVGVMAGAYAFATNEAGLGAIIVTCTLIAFIRVSALHGDVMERLSKPIPKVSAYNIGVSALYMAQALGGWWLAVLHLLGFMWATVMLAQDGMEYRGGFLQFCTACSWATVIGWSTLRRTAMDCGYRSRTL